MPFPDSPEALSAHILKDLINPEFVDPYLQHKNDFATLVAREHPLLWEFSKELKHDKLMRVPFRKRLAHLVAYWTPHLRDVEPALFVAASTLLESVGFIPSLAPPPQRDQFYTLITAYHNSGDLLALEQGVDVLFRGRWT